MPLVCYRCTKCNKDFTRHDDAVACEQSHAKVRRARAKKYTIGAYPFTVEVTFSDGKTKVYVLEDMAHTL